MLGTHRDRSRVVRVWERRQSRETGEFDWRRGIGVEVKREGK